eukprot:838978-Rhodomonas_salina.1
MFFVVCAGAGAGGCRGSCAGELDCAGAGDCACQERRPRRMAVGVGGTLRLVVTSGLRDGSSTQ